MRLDEITNDNRFEYSNTILSSSIRQGGIMVRRFSRRQNFGAFVEKGWMFIPSEEFEFLKNQFETPLSLSSERINLQSQIEQDKVRMLSSKIDENSKTIDDLVKRLLSSQKDNKALNKKIDELNSINSNLSDELKKRSGCLGAIICLLTPPNKALHRNA